MKLHDAIVDWCSKSVGEIMNSIDLKRQSLNIIMCLLAMDDLNDVMPQTKGIKFTKSVQYFAGAKTTRQVLEAGLDHFIPLIRHHKEMVSQMFDIKINVITSDWQTLNHKLALANTIFRKTFGLTLKGHCVKTGNPNVFELKLMDCFTYFNGVMMLKLCSGKLIKSNLNQPKPLAPVGELDNKSIDPMYDLPRGMSNIEPTDNDTLLTRQPYNIFRGHSCLQTSMKEGFFSYSARASTYFYSLSQGLRPGYLHGGGYFSSFL